VTHLLKFKDDSTKNRIVIDTLDHIESYMRFKNTFKFYYRLPNIKKRDKIFLKLMVKYNELAYQKYKADTITTSIYKITHTPLMYVKTVSKDQHRNPFEPMYYFILDTTIAR
jgi:hypothetical protein